MRPLIAAVALAPLLLLGACAPQAEGTRGYGVIVTDDGIKANNDRNHREDVSQHLTRDIDSALAPNWIARVHIDELPTWISTTDANDGDWRWSRATVHITLIGAGSLAHTIDEIRQGVLDYLTPRVQSPTTNLKVLVVTEAAAPPAANPVASPAANSAASPAASPVVSPGASSVAVSGPRTYTIQAGDTLADISTLFYAAPEHWRNIINANPGLNPAALVPGTVLVIPPRP
jgi:LysM repeat protein